MLTLRIALYTNFRQRLFIKAFEVKSMSVPYEVEYGNNRYVLDNSPATTSSSTDGVTNLEYTEMHKTALVLTDADVIRSPLSEQR